MKTTQKIQIVRWEWQTRHDPGCHRSLMIRFWKTTLAVCALVTVLALGFAAWSMFGVATEAGVAESRVGRDSTETLSREQMKTAIELFEKRKADFEAAKGGVQKPAYPFK